MKYNQIQQKDIAYFKTLFQKKEQILLGDDILEEYTHDELAKIIAVPEIVLRPLSTQEAAAVLKYAQERLIPVTPRGAGTGLVGAAVAVQGGIVIDLSLMNHILELDEENLTLTVEPGVLLMDIAAYVEERGYFYPPDPGEKSATIGGNIATNAGGMRAVKYGVTRDYIRGLEVVLPGGEIMNIGGKVVKNSSGYDLKDLIVGSEGTLGLITKAILKLIPKPNKTLSLLVPFHTLKEAIDTAPKIMKSQVVPTALEFMEREVVRDTEMYLGSKFPEKEAGAFLLLKFDACTSEEIDAYCQIAAKICMENGAYDVLISDTQEREEKIWKARGAFLEGIKAATTELDEIDMVVPRSRINEMLSYMNELAKQQGVRIKAFGHAGDGNLHVYLLKDQMSDEIWEEKLQWCMENLYQRGFSLQGKVSGEHGIGYAKKLYFHQTADQQVLEIMKKIKLVFDPKYILNPGKIFDGTAEASFNIGGE